MNTFFKSSFIKLFILFMLSIFILLNCNDSTKPDPDPPTIPPQTTFLMDLSDFNTGGNPKIFPDQLAKNSTVLTQDNYGHAAINVWVWSWVTSAAMLVPAAAFAATINQDPQYQGDLEWLWSNSFPTVNPQFTSKLYGKISGDVVEWRMYISQTGGYIDFLWYTGESNLDATGGSWIFNDSPENPENILEVTWHRTGNEIADLKYENIESGSNDEGAYILFELTGETTYDAAFELYNAQTSNLINVKWHRINQNGRVKDPAYFSDSDWHCWDESHEDIDCP